MRLPAPLLRPNPNVHKNTFGHVLVLAGSRTMVGAAALTALSAMRTGAGLVTLGIPESLNEVAQKKISPVIMTFPLKETNKKTIALMALNQIMKRLSSFDVVALGPGLSQNQETQRFILHCVLRISKPLVIDADALNALSRNLRVLKKNKGITILTPHPGEFARLSGFKKNLIERNRMKVAKEFSRDYNCVLVLKGFRTVVASPDGHIHINKTGNPGMATAGSGDVLTGMIVALLAQGLSAFEAAKWGSYLHGKAGNLAAKEKTKAGMIATDIIDKIPDVLKRCLSS